MESYRTSLPPLFKGSQHSIIFDCENTNLRHCLDGDVEVTPDSDFNSDRPHVAVKQDLGESDEEIIITHEVIQNRSQAVNDSTIKSGVPSSKRKTLNDSTFRSEAPSNKNNNYHTDKANENGSLNKSKKQNYPKKAHYSEDNDCTIVLATMNASVKDIKRNSNKDTLENEDNYEIPLKKANGDSTVVEDYISSTVSRTEQANLQINKFTKKRVMLNVKQEKSPVPTYGKSNVCSTSQDKLREEKSNKFTEERVIVNVKHETNPIPIHVNDNFNSTSQDDFRDEKCDVYHGRDSENGTMATDIECIECINKEIQVKDVKHVSVAHGRIHLFSCTLCGYKSKYWSGIIAHLNGKHQMGEQFICNYCDYTCFWDQTFKKHLKKHLKKAQNIYSCMKGEERTKNCRLVYREERVSDFHEKESVNHIQTTSMVCSTCNKKANQVKNIKHVSIAHGIIHALACTLCGFQTEQKWDIILHLRRKHQIGERYQCNYCNSIVLWENSMMSHLKRSHQVSFNRKWEQSACHYRKVPLEGDIHHEDCDKGNEMAG